MPKISIIVPAYNEEKTIATTLESLLHQTYSDYEIIVVNNNSKDKTALIAKQYVPRVYNEKKQGYHNAVNYGVTKAHAPIITICDADSIYPPTWIETIMYEFEQNPEIVAVYGTVQFHDYNFFVNFVSHVGFTFFIRLSKILGFDNTAGFNFAMKKKAYQKVGGYNPKIYDNILTDVELGRRLQKIGTLKQNHQITVYTSSRRFKEDGLLKTTLYFLDAWYRLNYGKTQKINYTQYNMHWRNKSRSPSIPLAWLKEVKTILETGKDELYERQKKMQKQGKSALDVALKRLNTAIEFTDKHITSLMGKMK